MSKMGSEINMEAQSLKSQWKIYHKNQGQACVGGCGWVAFEPKGMFRTPFFLLVNVLFKFYEYGIKKRYMRRMSQLVSSGAVLQYVLFAVRSSLAPGLGSKFRFLKETKSLRFCSYSYSKDLYNRGNKTS